jgi:uncharacterized membrane protein YecN with MAPEG domain
MSILWQSSLYAFGFYAALNALIMLVLGILVVRARVVTQTDIGDGGKPAMAGPLRAHGNNSEWVPMALLLMWALASRSDRIDLADPRRRRSADARPHRARHRPVAVARALPLRFIGMILTWIAFIVGIVGILWLVFTPQAAAS